MSDTGDAALAFHDAAVAAGDDGKHMAAENAAVVIRLSGAGLGNEWNSIESTARAVPPCNALRTEQGGGG